VSYLLDTNVVSELAREIPDSRVVAWIRRNHADCFLSAITIGELVKGIELLPEGKKRRRLSKELRFLQQDYRDRIIAYDEATAIEWGRLYAEAKRKNRRLSLEDSLIEATALNYRLTVVTRNEKDFFRVTTADPWRALV
jgi:predicted nucleic acid-binding protein